MNSQQKRINALIFFALISIMFPFRTAKLRRTSTLTETVKLGPKFIFFEPSSEELIEKGLHGRLVESGIDYGKTILLSSFFAGCAAGLRVVERKELKATKS
jgi:hypothetical protein